MVPPLCPSWRALVPRNLAVVLVVNGTDITLLDRPAVVTYRPTPHAAPATARVVEELQPIGYLRVFRRDNNTFLHVTEWDILNINGQPA